MKYVLTDTSISLILDGKPVNLSLESSFNYRKIHSLLSSGDFTESQIRELVKPPEEVEGFYVVKQVAPTKLLVYNKATQTFTLLHQVKDAPETWYSTNNAQSALAMAKTLGVYPNVNSIIFDFPEHFL